MSEVRYESDLPGFECQPTHFLGSVPGAPRCLGVAGRLGEWLLNWTFFRGGMGVDSGTAFKSADDDSRRTIATAATDVTAAAAANIMCYNGIAAMWTETAGLCVGFRPS